MRLKATGHFKLGWFLRFIAPSGMLACGLIILTASPSISSNTLAEAPTRFGTVTIVEHCDESGSCSKASATLGSKTIDLVINSANKIVVNILAIFPTPDGDLVILDIPGGRALPYCCLAALLVRNATDLEVISKNAAFYAQTLLHFAWRAGMVVSSLTSVSKTRNTRRLSTTTGSSQSPLPVANRRRRSLSQTAHMYSKL